MRGPCTNRSSATDSPSVPGPVPRNLARMPSWAQTPCDAGFPTPAGRKPAAHRQRYCWLSAPSPRGVLSSQGCLVGLRFHRAANQNHLLVASLLERGLGESAYQQRVFTSRDTSPWPWFLPVPGPAASTGDRKLLSRGCVFLPAGSWPIPGVHRRVSSKADILRKDRHEP